MSDERPTIPSHPRAMLCVAQEGVIGVARIEVVSETAVHKDIDHAPEPRRPVIRSMLMSKNSGVSGRSSAPRTVFT